ncbi:MULTISPECIES: aldehyde dehydrogenase family protein [unclassified Microbacterium]|uniref:aldehyde dehydrogenase family protein n=1 Tax=unclassified Microbacterium TaxID=2609290 RepID=UPI000CFDD3C6|nr:MULTISPECIES: aldehyde dehydrogenase family protein [unclassified Microbacterium]PQZ58025.1 aldehyde dehydrogenase [Microbacterium sp. MYb43]PQZ80760.1 aldehyde dehydrogenase [Microbacterium sp. MYb40]PRB20312.1 aldehyde dehydrogenase [Microbacterium sp. MYb54]PRB31983.1 aldehyde dehydrogenase [Microbacterium sp. MYb50]PRB66427.1 aldehyde dehydrogenase [Microbacterium sp. MYb24]
MSETAPVLDEAALLERVGAPEGQGREVVDAATREPIGRAPVHTVEQLDAAIARAKAAQPAWDALGHAERSALLVRVADAIDANAEPLARLLSREQGKPLNGPNARFEVGACSAWLRTAAATPLEPETVVDDGETHAELHYRAIGVVGAIGPWNWPLMIGIWQIAPALRMGNTVVVKPSGYTTLSVLALIEVMNQVLPRDVLIGVAGDREVGARIASHPDIGKVMFTGSTATGRSIVESSAKNLARLTLELGGNDAGIVLPGVDATAIAQDLFWGAFINTGQTCAALKRLYVHDSVYDEVVEALAEVVRQTPMGNGLDEQNVLGPLQNHAQFEIVRDLVEDAARRGGRIVTGGRPATELGELFYPVTLVADVSDGVALVDEEQFGPALPIIRYTDVDDAVASANGLDVGLGASVWGERDEARKVAARIQAGTVWINSHGGVHPMIPFGGHKSSGYGLEFGVEGLKSVAVPQIING